MPGLYEQFETDSDVEKTGIVLEYGNNSKGKPIGIRIARAGGSNIKYLKQMEARTKPFKRQIQNEALDLPQAEKLIMDVYCETVVLGWENVEDRDGNDIPFSKAAAIKLFTDLPDLFRVVQEEANRSALFRRHIQEADSKN